MQDVRSGTVANVTPPLTQWASKLVEGDRRTLARSITRTESTRPDDREIAEALLDEVLPHTGGSIRLGITGTPGVGKSTFIDALGMLLIRAGHRVAVLAVDPTSSRNGGSILGDKTRMAELSKRSEAFIRPSPSGGLVGGVARRTRDALLLCEAAGYDVVIVETMGVGQAETAVAEICDLFLLLVAPGGGDELQGIKRGIMELADVVAVNKADGALSAAAKPHRGRLPSRPAHGATQMAGDADAGCHLLSASGNRTGRAVGDSCRCPRAAGRRGAPR